MASSRIKLAPKVVTPIVVVDAFNKEYLKEIDAIWVLRAPGMLVLDNYPWSSPIESLQKFQENKPRAYDTPFSTAGRSPELDKALEPFHQDMEYLFELFYGKHYRPESIRHSWRPMISANEPIHFDSNYKEGTISITSYLNFSQTPRYYGISHTLPWLVENQPKAVLKSAGPDPFCPKQVVTELRGAAERGEPPLGKSPRHYLWFATGSVWFFDPKLVSHELLGGDGAVCYTWRVETDVAEHLPEYHLQKLRNL